MNRNSKLLAELYAIDHVQGAELHWSPALTVKIRLDDMDWDARRAALVLVSAYLNEPEQEWLGRVDVEFDIPEPVNFTRAKLLARAGLTNDQSPANVSVDRS